jgi:hypothetical protein
VGERRKFENIKKVKCKAKTYERQRRQYVVKQEMNNKRYYSPELKILF